MDSHPGKDSWAEVGEPQQRWLEARGGLAVWVAGLLSGLAVIGPALRPGAILTLDLIVADRIQVPSGVWGLGPEPPRRVPFFVPLSWVASVLDGAWVVKLVMVALVTIAFVGTWRLASGARPVARLGAALAYACGPFMATRLGVGHLTVVAAAAVLPWALPALLHPSRSIRRTLIWCSLMGACGINGGILAGFAVGAGLLFEKRRRVPQALAAALLGQLPWLMPALVVSLAQPTRAEGSEWFATQSGGVLGLPALLGGHGFWQDAYQTGAATVWVPALAGAVITFLAVVGTHRLETSLQKPLLVLAFAGFVLATASLIPGIRAVLAEATQAPVGAPFREAQRFLPMLLVWQLPAAALGATEVAERWGGALIATPLVAALAVSVPGLWGVDGRLEPVELPPEWSRARSLVEAEPGTVLALPWHQYMVMEAAGGRRLLNPVPFVLGGDVLVSSNPELGPIGYEPTDRRERAVFPLVVAIRSGEPVAEELAELGVRWVAVLHEVDWERYSGVVADEGLEHVLGGESLDLYRVSSWRGPVLAGGSSAERMSHVVEPLATTDLEGEATWFRPGSAGWLRGFESLQVTADGLLRIPAGSGPIWYWPAVPVAAGHLVTVAAATWAAASLRRRSQALVGESDSDVM